MKLAQRSCGLLRFHLQAGAWEPPVCDTAPWGCGCRPYSISCQLQQKWERFLPTEIMLGFLFKPLSVKSPVSGRMLGRTLLLLTERHQTQGAQRLRTERKRAEPRVFSVCGVRTLWVTSEVLG